MSVPGAFTATLGETSPQYPRNSEGDVVLLRDGRLLACWTRFYGGPQDHSPAHIAARTSADGGRAWSEPWVIQENVGKQNVMSASFLRERASGDILFFYGIKNSDTDLLFYCRRSADEGAAWSDPVLVTGDPGYHVINNARIIQLSSGRVIAPDALCTWAEPGFRAYHFACVIYSSDDGGQSWQRAPDMVDIAKGGAEEPGVVELADGRLLMIIRTHLGQVYKSYSADGGLTWTEAEPLGVAAPTAPSTIARIPTTGDFALFHNPSFPTPGGFSQRRCPLVVSISRDEGQTWEQGATLEDDPELTYAYLSCMFHDGRALLTYYVCCGQGFDSGVSQRFMSLPVHALYRDQEA